DGSITILGGAADESFAFVNGPSPAVIQIDGGGGVNTLDYSAYNSTLPSLVSWYQGENNADDGVGVNHGALNGDVTFVPGRSGQAFDFDGNGDYVDLGSDATLNLPGSMSVSLWVRLDTLDHYKYLLADFVSDGVTSQGSL